MGCDDPSGQYVPELIPVSDKIKVKEIRGKNGIKLLMMIHD